MKPRSRGLPTGGGRRRRSFVQTTPQTLKQKAAAKSAESTIVQRDVLPIPDVSPVQLTMFDAKDPDSKFPPIMPIRPPKGAPNVLIILIDDVGFGASSAFGGPCNTNYQERRSS